MFPLFQQLSVAFTFSFRRRLGPVDPVAFECFRLLFHYSADFLRRQVSFFVRTNWRGSIPATARSPKAAFRTNYT
jgi:hypothetical protein